MNVWTCREPDEPAGPGDGLVFCNPPTADSVEYCGCDGVTRLGTSSCPPGPYAFKGDCEDPCSGAHGSDGYCWNDYGEAIDPECCSDAAVDAGPDGGLDGGAS